MPPVRPTQSRHSSNITSNIFQPEISNLFHILRRKQTKLFYHQSPQCLLIIVIIFLQYPLACITGCGSANAISYNLCFMSDFFITYIMRFKFVAWFLTLQFVRQSQCGLNATFKYYIVLISADSHFTSIIFYYLIAASW